MHRACRRRGGTALQHPTPGTRLWTPETGDDPVASSARRAHRMLNSTLTEIGESATAPEPNVNSGGGMMGTPFERVVCPWDF